MTDDIPLLRRVAGGDGSAVQDCLSTYGGLVWSIARKMLGPSRDAEDAVQEIFIELWRMAHRFDETRGTESQFVAMLARRRVIDRVRKIERRPDHEGLPEGLQDEGRDQVEAAELSEEAARAREAMTRLSEDQQQVLQLAVVQGLSHAEVARATAMPLGTVKTHARRGLIRLRELLGPSDGTGSP
jgi:RNA polymerase sigma-70 factor (ECF subfamily)